MAAQTVVGPDTALPSVLLRLADPGSVEPLSAVDDCGVVTAGVRVGGVPAVCYASVPRVRGGALTVEGCDRIVAAIEHARRMRLPVVALWHSGGAALHEGVPALDGVARVFAAIVRASGRVPQLSVMLGPAAGGAAYGAALTDVVVLTGDARVFVTGPTVIEQVTGSRVSAAELGGPNLHGRVSGVAHVVASDVDAALGHVAQLISLLGRPGRTDLEMAARPAPDPGRWLPDSARRAYDVRPLVLDLLDNTPDNGAARPPFVALQELWAPNMVTGLGRLGGGTVGVVANNPLRRGGCLDARAGDKAARFVRLCDAFGVPLVVLVDVPGYLPGLDEERRGVLRRGAKLLHAFAAAQVPRVTVVLRKAFGGAYIAMNSKHLGATATFAWPTADIGIMAAEAAVEVLHRRELAADGSTDIRAAVRQRLVAAYRAGAGGLAAALAGGSVDALIEPASTRATIAAVFAEQIAVPAAITNIPL
jgi:acetyl-CoA/propionyl-CoA carboxylase carboxyl transferase subunit